MGWRDWFRRRSQRDDRELVEWRQSWAAAAARFEQPEVVAALRRDLERLALPDEEVELEREMLEALDRGAALSAHIASAGLPAIETGHRIVGSERCHFIAPASIPDDPSQPSGRLLLTSGRMIFAGGAKTIALAWHTVGEARHADRDLVIVAVDRQRVFRFRCNTFADAVCGALVARRLTASGKRRL